MHHEVNSLNEGSNILHIFVRTSRQLTYCPRQLPQLGERLDNRDSRLYRLIPLKIVASIYSPFSINAFSKVRLLGLFAIKKFDRKSANS